jgi:hypothetical protein
MGLDVLCPAGPNSPVAEVARSGRREGLGLLAVDVFSLGQTPVAPLLLLLDSVPVPKSYGVQALDPHASGVCS